MRVWELLIPLILFLIAFIPRFLTAKKLRMTWEEIYPLCGCIFLKNIVTLNFSPKAWNFMPRPPVLMYLYGLGYSIYTFIRASLKYGLRKLNYGLLVTEASSLTSSSSSLVAMRLPPVILGSLSSVIVYAFALDLFGDIRIALLSALILALTPHFIAQSSVAASDGGLASFWLFTSWSLYRAITLESFWYLLLSAILLGLTLGSKETGFLYPLATMPWLVFSSLVNYELLHALRLIFIWLLIGMVVLYVCWPFIWRKPLTNLLWLVRAYTNIPRGLHAAGFYRGTSKPKPDFYVVNLIVTSPLYLLPLYAVGMLEVAFHSNAISSILLFSWVLIPLVILSLPITEYRDGVRQIMFILPALSIFAGAGLWGVVNYLSQVFPEFGWIAYLSAIAVVGLIAFECFTIHPYYLDYYNQLVGGIKGAANNYLVGWWGNGMGPALAYVDQHAPLNSTIWIYGPKTTAFYHSKRVNLETSFQDGPFFTAIPPLPSGFTSSINERTLLSLRKGDLTFYFPYYHPNKHNGLRLDQLSSENVSYIIIYRRQSYPGQVDPGNYKLITTLLEHHNPAYTVRIKGIEYCWVFDVKSIKHMLAMKPV